MNNPIILASSSRYRRALLERLGFPFTSISPDIDESAHSGETPQQLVERLAIEKAQAVAEQVNHNHIIIGSDQLAVCNGQILGKPGNHAAAIQQLSRSSGQQVSFLTSLCVLLPAQQYQAVTTVPINVQFRQLHLDEIERYLHAEQPYDCAGSFKSEGLGVSLFERVQTDDLTALEGLPLISLCKFLRDAGLQLP